MKNNNNEEVNGYRFTKQWFDFASKNPNIIKPSHGILYLAIVELNNKLGWIEEFGLPTLDTMQLIGIRNHKTYKKTLDNLINWGFVNLIEKSQNQYTSNIIALVKFTSAKDKGRLLPDIISNTKTNDECSGKINLSTALSTTLTTAHIIKQEETIQTNQTILGVISNEDKEENNNISLIKGEETTTPIEKEKAFTYEEEDDDHKIHRLLKESYHTEEESKLSIEKDNSTNEYEKIYRAMG